MKFFENCECHTSEGEKDDYIEYLKKLFSDFPMTYITAYHITL